MKVTLFLTGEGNSDIGYRDYVSNEFVPREMTHVAAAVVRKSVEKRATTAELEYEFLSEKELSDLVRHSPASRRQAVLTSRLTLASSADSKFPGLWIRARVFAGYVSSHLSDGSGEHMAVVFTDADGTRSAPRAPWRRKFDALLGGFREAKYDAGVPMVPQPKSEAWLLGYYQKDMEPKHPVYQNCARFEALAGNDDANPKNSAKHILAGILKNGTPTAEELASVDWDQVQMPSFDAFKGRVDEVVRSFKMLATDRSSESGKRDV